MIAAAVASSPEPCIVLHDVSWDTYVALREQTENKHLRMTYDEGTLEIMAPSFAHGRYGSFIAKIVNAWTEERGIPVVSCDDLTIRRKDIQKGFEPDKCFYVQHEPEMWQKLEFDAAVDPPPDLAIEVEISRSAMTKITSVYAAFGVPEVWRYDGSRLLAYQLFEGEYRPCDTSFAFPELALATVEHLVRQVGQVRELELIDQFRQWVRNAFRGVDE